MEKRSIADYAFCLGLSVALVFAVNLSIITSTVMIVSHGTLLAISLCMIVFFMLVFYNRFTMLVMAAFLTLLALFVLMNRDKLASQWETVGAIMALTRGQMPFETQFTLPLVCLITSITALLTVVCLYVRFNFYLLAVLGSFSFVLNWVMGYRRSDMAFMIFLCCLCVLLVRKMNPDRHHMPTIFAAAPICLLVVWGASRFAIADTSFNSNVFSKNVNDRLASINEFFHTTFNPKYFSFQTTGFSAQNNRLGGPVTVNDREVMTVTANGRVYLSGASRNTYTGHNWENTIDDGLYTAEYDVGWAQTAFLETAAALMRNFTYISDATGQEKSDIKADDVLVFSYEIGETQTDYRDDMTLSYIEAVGTAPPPNGDRPSTSGKRSYIVTYLPISQLVVNIGSYRTGTLFRPPKNMSVVFENPTDYDYEVTYAATGDMQTRRLMERDASYRFQYLQVDDRKPAVIELLKKAHRGYYAAFLQTADVPKPSADWDAAGNLLTLIGYYAALNPDNAALYTVDVEKTFASVLNMYMQMVLVDYAAQVYQNYTGLPDTMPQRVYDLAYEITAGCKSDYARVKAIEQYLAKFPYTLTPTNVPQGQDFVDYFLFEGQEGYCVYYASAMAVLSRCVGIPSRFVEGYLLPPTAAGGMTVTNRQAHAWAEVYLEGYGWLTMEATAPYHVVAENQQTAAATEVFASEFIDDPYYQDYLALFGIDSSYTEVWRPDTETRQTETMADTQTSSHIYELWMWLIVAGGLLLLMIYIWSQMAWQALRYRRIDRMDANRQAMTYYEGITKMTNYYHYPVQGGETPQRYSRRLGNRFAFNSDQHFLRDLTALYYKAKYSAHTLSDAERALMKNSYFEMVHLLRSVRAWPAYIYLRYIKKVML